MQYILNQRYDETFSINFLGSELLNSSKRVLVLKTEGEIKGISGITSLADSVLPDETNIIKKFKYSQCDNWSDLLDISELTGITLNTNCCFSLELYYYFVDNGNVNAPSVTISNVIINGNYSIDKTSGVLTLTEPNKSIILEPVDIYKIFNLTDFQATVGGVLDENDLEIQFRITQDGGYTYTKWFPLTKENLIAIRKDINELRFAKVQYLVTKTDNNQNPIIIYDIMLIGEFQNVSANYLLTNRYGIREDCATQLANSSSSAGISNTLNNNYDTQGLSCYTSGNNKETISSLKEWNTSNTGLWNPYAQSSQITNFYSFLANQTNNLFGWNIEYYKTDPDGNGIDYQIHEYGLFNVYKKANIKVIVPENQFPDNTVQLNQFNLDLFDTFEIHILKDVFKEAFGIEERPAQKDYLFFCITNRLYTIKHAQVFKEIMNAGIYYKVILEKYEERANILVRDKTVKEAIDTLTDNTTIDELFGFEKKQDEAKIANKDQTYPTSFDKIRQSISNKVSIINEKIYNGEVDFIHYYYNFSNLLNQKAVIYKNVDNTLNINDDRSFINWFKFNSNYDETKSLNSKMFNTYNINDKFNFTLLDNYDIDKNTGYKYFYMNKKISFVINKESFTLDVPNLYTNIWYGVFINLNQRQREVNIKLYKRLTTINTTFIHPDSYEKIDLESTNISAIGEAISNGFKPIYNYETDSTAISKFILLYEKTFKNINIQSFNHTEDIKLIGSDICYSNLRIFDGIIEDENINNILNQNIIRDAGRLIIADNANRKIYTKNIPNKNFK